MAITVPDLVVNLKDLKDLRVALNVVYLDVERVFVPISELHLAMLVDFTLRSLNINLATESSSEPILLIQVKVGRTNIANIFRIGAAVSVRELVLLPRTFPWPMPPPLTPPTNTWADTWSTASTASLQVASAVNGQVQSDVGRLLDEFMTQWRSVN